METQNNENATVVAEEKNDNNQSGTHFEHIKETLELLYTTFPKAFVKDGQVKPLKIGIFEDLRQRVASIEGLSVSKVRAALRLYTSRLKYLYSVKEGAKRIDLDGNECADVVNAEHESYAKEQIALINSKRKPAKPKTVNKDNKKPFNKNNKFVSKKPPKVEGQKPSLDELKVGTNVLVLSSEKSCVKGVVAEDAQKDSVYVTLKSGLTVNLPLERILIPKKAK